MRKLLFFNFEILWWSSRKSIN